VLNGGTGSRFELQITEIALVIRTDSDAWICAYLDDGLAIFSVLGIDDDLQVHSLLLHDALQSYPNRSQGGWSRYGMTERHGPLRLTQRLFVLKILNLRTIWKDAFRIQPCRVGGLGRRTRLELLRVLRRDLGNLKQANLALIIDEGSTLFGHPFQPYERIRTK